jgi:hypothetical protein
LGDCDVIDISILGAGIEVYGDVPGDLLGRRLVAEVQAPIGASVSIRLVGEVRYTEQGANGGTRVGIEFTDLSETERQILHMMELLKVVW